jgi:hypothetical protein
VVVKVVRALAGQLVTVDGQAVIVAVRVERMVDVVEPAPPDPPWDVLEPDPPPGVELVPEKTAEDELLPLSLLLAVVDTVVEEAAEVAADEGETALVEDVLVLVPHGLDNGLTLVEDG